MPGLWDACVLTPPDPTRRRVRLEVPWPTLFKLLAAAALVWLWLRLVPIVLLMVVAVLLAVTLMPLVSWLERRRLSRGWAVTIVSLGLLALIGGFVALTWASLSAQGQYLVQHLDTVEQQVIGKLPAWAQNAIGVVSDGSGNGGGASGGVQGGVASAAGSYALRLAQSVVSAVTVMVLGFILTIYLLIEGRETRDWLLAFVPRPQRAKALLTLEEGRTVIFGYMAGNGITSIIATTSTLLVLWVLQVPAAFLLALIAGLSDFIPVIGFPLSAVPAILLAFTVSPNTALLVVVFYVAYNTIENYLLSPWAYGTRMKLSNVAIILSFAVGGQIAGVIGALIALPLAALYPPIERIWLRDKLGDEVVEEHKAIEQGS
jgi:predicted PurR-regulated permease PerM